jgi:hypothetical protein
MDDATFNWLLSSKAIIFDMIVTEQRANRILARVVHMERDAEGRARAQERDLSSRRRRDDHQAHNAKFRQIKERFRTLQANIESALASIDELCSRSPNEVTAEHLRDLGAYADRMRRFIKTGMVGDD